MRGGELQPPLGMLSGALEDKIKSCQLNVGFPQSHCSFWKARRSLPEKARRCEGAAREMPCAGLSGWEERALGSGQSASPVEFVTTGPGGVPCAFVFKPTQQAFSGPLSVPGSCWRIQVNKSPARGCRPCPLGAHSPGEGFVPQKMPNQTVLALDFAHCPPGGGTATITEAGRRRCWDGPGRGLHVSCFPWKFPWLSPQEQSSAIVAPKDLVTLT